MSALGLALLLSLAFSIALLAVIAALLIKNAKKNRFLRSAAKSIKRRDKLIKRVFRIYNDFIVSEVKAGSVDQLDKVMSALTENEIRNVRRTSVMGIARLLMEKRRPGGGGASHS